jgi:hypothetical protein
MLVGIVLGNFEAAYIGGDMVLGFDGFVMIHRELHKESGAFRLRRAIESRPAMAAYATRFGKRFQAALLLLVQRLSVAAGELDRKSVV